MLFSRNTIPVDLGLGVTAPRGFRASGIAAGIKPDRKDLAVVINDGPDVVSAEVLTQNRVFAAPIRWMKETGGTARKAVILNSGGANASTGEEGYQDTVKTAQVVAAKLGTELESVAVCSTGMIGERLPMERLIPGAELAITKLSDDGGADAAHAIMTTDTRAKQAGIAGEYTIGSMAKGAGMLAPGMATMLCVVTTDAVLTEAEARHALELATTYSFNRIDSDGAMSTNDTVILMASGASGVTPKDFPRDLTAVMQSLARQLIGDAEGASHDVLIRVLGASSESAGLAVARAVSRSNLLKAAIFGNDPNWGRVIAQTGTVPAEVAPFDPDKIDVWFNGIHVCRAGGVGEDRSRVDLAANRDVTIEIDLHAGTEIVELWTNDLTHDYVHENSAYSS